MKKIIVSVFIILLLIISIGFYFNHLLINKNKIIGEFEIKKGETISKIAQNLTDKKFIKNPFIFKFGVRIYKQGKNIKAGYYKFNGKYNLKELITELTKGSSKLKKITIPEGLTCFEVFEKLEDSGFGKKSVYLEYFYKPSLILPEQFKNAETLEGFLFPETYMIREKANEFEILKIMVKEFIKNYEKVEKPKNINLTPYQAIILASLVEKETNGKNEEKIIASVFLNRLSKKMRLQCDPTIIYALILEGKYDGNIRKKDINMENRFNTYYISGLPPTPIANPGFKALNSVYNPDNTDYLYFVSNNEGNHIFSKTYKEHLKNVEKYQIKYWRKKRWQKKKQ